MKVLTHPHLWSALLSFAGVAALATPEPRLPPLAPGTAAAWVKYASVTAERAEREMAGPKGFLALDFGTSAAADRAAVLAGQTPIAQMFTAGPGGRTIDVPDSWVHHWRGAVLIPGAKLDRVFQRLQEEIPGTGKGDVLASAILAREGLHLRTSIKVQRQGRFIVAYHFVYNTEHDVMFTRRNAARGSSTSTATKIAELHDPGTADERELPAGEDNRLLERWNSYWRYEEVPAGVIAECESITLSRGAPFGLGWTRSYADSTARAAMERALVTLRDFFATPVRTPHASSPVR